MATTVYLATSLDVLDDFQVLNWDVADGGDSPRFDGTSLARDWTNPPAAYIGNITAPRPDVFTLLGPGCWVTTMDTVDLLEPFVSRSAELLPLNVTTTGERLLIVNVVQVIDCLAPDAITKNPLDLRPRFLEHRLPDEGMFAVPELGPIHLFAVERDGQESVRQRATDLGLTGITFIPVWSSSQGQMHPGLLLGT